MSRSTIATARLKNHLNGVSSYYERDGFRPLSTGHNLSSRLIVSAPSMRAHYKERVIFMISIICFFEKLIMLKFDLSEENLFLRSVSDALFQVLIPGNESYFSSLAKYNGIQTSWAGSGPFWNCRHIPRRFNC